MHRGILLIAGGIALFVAGVLFSGSRDAFGLVPVTPYEADVNKSGQVNAIDLQQVAAKFGQPVPTATATPTSVCDLSRRTLPSAILRSGTVSPTDGFNGCQFVQSNLFGADMAFSYFHDSDFTDASLQSASLRYTEFDRAELVRADLRSTNLIAGHLPFADLSEADLTGADIRNAYFAGAVLRDAQLVAVNAASARFDGADLTGAVLSGSPNAFAGASFQDAVTTGANVSGVIWGPGTVCPDGTNTDTNGGTCIGHGF